MECNHIDGCSRIIDWTTSNGIGLGESLHAIGLGKANGWIITRPRLQPSRLPKSRAAHELPRILQAQFQ